VRGPRAPRGERRRHVGALWCAHAPNTSTAVVAFVLALLRRVWLAPTPSFPPSLWVRPTPWRTVWRQGGLFRLALTIPDTYPAEPPTVRFLTRSPHGGRLHPHVPADGEIYHPSVTAASWSPAESLRGTLLAVQALLGARRGHPELGLCNAWRPLAAATAAASLPVAVPRATAPTTGAGYGGGSGGGGGPSSALSFDALRDACASAAEAPAPPSPVVIADGTAAVATYTTLRYAVLEAVSPRAMSKGPLRDATARAFLLFYPTYVAGAAAAAAFATADPAAWHRALSATTFRGGVYVPSRASVAADWASVRQRLDDTRERLTELFTSPAWVLPTRRDSTDSAGRAASSDEASPDEAEATGTPSGGKRAAGTTPDGRAAGGPPAVSTAAAAAERDARSGESPTVGSPSPPYPWDVLTAPDPPDVEQAAAFLSAEAEALRDAPPAGILSAAPRDGAHPFVWDALLPVSRGGDGDVDPVLLPVEVYASAAHPTVAPWVRFAPGCRVYHPNVEPVGGVPAVAATLPAAAGGEGEDTTVGAVLTALARLMARPDLRWAVHGAAAQAWRVDPAAVWSRLRREATRGA